jgi:hypothetical protein
MKSEKVFFFIKIFHRSLQRQYRSSALWGSPQRQDEGIAGAPWSVRRTRSCEYFMIKLGAENGIFPKNSLLRAYSRGFIIFIILPERVATPKSTGMCSPWLEAPLYLHPSTYHAIW